jgi:hypothetical protein
MVKSFFKYKLLLFACLMGGAILLSECHTKNKCFGCPGIMKKKKVRKSSKGSI